MPRTRSIAWSELKLGVVGIAAMLLMTVAVIAVGGQGGFPWQRSPLKAAFAQVDGLKTGAIVRLNGKEVGKVTAIEFAGSRIDVSFDVSNEVRALITTASQASIGSLSLLGEPILDLTAAESGTPLTDWAYVPTTRQQAFGDLTAGASATLDEVGRLIADVRGGRGTAGKLVADPALYDELRQFASAAADVAGALKQGKGTVGRLLRDSSVHDDLRGSLDRLRVVIEKIDTGQGPLGRLLNDKAIARSIDGVAANAEQITARLNRGEGTAGKLLTDRQLYDRLAAVSERVERLVGTVENGQGTAGRLLKDAELYDNLTRASTELRGLIEAIRKDPKKYLNVRVSIF
jgi:phospholipid/cholesterol/gamma-HCH transport system substrate-binding protein